MRKELKAPIAKVLADYVPQNTAEKPIEAEYKDAFKNTVRDYFADESAVAAFRQYSVELGYNGEAFPAELLEKFLIRLLNRLDEKAAINQEKNLAAASIQEAILAELAVPENLRQAAHVRPKKIFRKGLYIWEEVILGYSTYALDDGVTAVDRVVKKYRLW